MKWKLILVLFAILDERGGESQTIAALIASVMKFSVSISGG